MDVKMEPIFHAPLIASQEYAMFLRSVAEPVCVMEHLKSLNAVMKLARMFQAIMKKVVNAVAAVH
jgi:hypothetical protein